MSKKPASPKPHKPPKTPLITVHSDISPLFLEDLPIPETPYSIYGFLDLSEPKKNGKK